jgi:hypothetical protein
MEVVCFDCESFEVIGIVNQYENAERQICVKSVPAVTTRTALSESALL